MTDNHVVVFKINGADGELIAFYPPFPGGTLSLLVVSDDQCECSTILSSDQRRALAKAMLRDLED